MHTVTINPDDPKSIQAALNTEWLLTNGLGGYAMGTALGVNTRRYHGLLVAATKPPVGRIVALHSMIEQLIIPRDDGTEEVIDLSTQQFGEEALLHPDGWKLPCECKVDSSNTITWTWYRAGLRVFRQLHLHGNHVRIRYGVRSKNQRALLRLRPIVSLRNFHSMDREQGSGWATEEIDDQSTFGVSIRRDAYSLLLQAHPGHWKPVPQWWRQFAYHRDRERGQEWLEDAWSPGYLEIADTRDQHIIFHASAGIWGDPVSAVQRSALPSRANHLVIAANQFVVNRLERKARPTLTSDVWQFSVIAGYPWFGDWGRDTMISLPGLMLCTGRFEEARSTLLTFARSMKNGLLPNLFDDYGAAEHYNTVDASLWFVHAVHELWKEQYGTSRDRKGADAKPTDAQGSPKPLPDGRGSLNEREAFDELLRACREIIAAYRRGTDFNIRMDPADGLIAAGDESTQLTWMDAKRDGIAFTPRNGKPVEINALWFNALHCLAEMTDDPRERDDLNELSEKVAKSFREQFWWKERQCLHDVLQPLPGSRGSDDSRHMDAANRDATVGERFASDRRLRPNQIFAASLPFSPLARDQQRAVVNIVRERLLTPYGLRTLDRDDPQYRGRYEGNLFERDSAYHQGTVWPWLIGPYCEALLHINDFSADAKRQVRQIIQPLIDEMSNTSGGRCLNQIAEVYDGDPPHRPSGCPAQAWSVAEILRTVTLIENEKSKRPKV